MKPLVIITTFNRKWETAQMLEALEATTDLHNIHLAIVDNGSSDGTEHVIAEWCRLQLLVNTTIDLTFYPLGENIGCPRALNLVLSECREPGQPVVKLDNDVRVLTAGWVEKLHDLVENWESPLALVSAYYDGVTSGRLLGRSRYKGLPVYEILPVIGHAVWHTGAFMDRVGYFDVLAPEHLYGFEDLLLSHKASVLGWDTITWEGWQIENLQRHNSLGDKRDEHVERMRPLYNQRVAALDVGGVVQTRPDGCPVSTSD